MGLILLFACLSHDDFEAREVASARLLHLVDRHPGIYGPRVVDLARATTCPETRSRMRPIVACYRRWLANAFVPTSVPVWPCVDCMPAANPLVPFGLASDVRDFDRELLCFDRTSGDTHSGPYWHSYRAATERLIRRKLIDGETAEACDRLLERAWAIEHRTCRDNPSWVQASPSWRTWQGGYPRP